MKSDFLKETQHKKTILTFCQWYYPGYKAGGPIRTIQNMVDHLGDTFNFKIITTDRDLGDKTSYNSIDIDQWNSVGKAEVLYLSPSNRSFKDFTRIINLIDYDILYLNSFFDPVFTIQPLILKKLHFIPDKPVVVAPRGEFSTGALQFKTTKKKIYICVSNLLRLYSGINWQASSEYEKKDIERALGVNDKQITIAENLPSVINSASTPMKKKVPGKLDIIFLSRVDRKKNLDGALKILSSLHTESNIIFDIYGPITDSKYWEECQILMNKLPSNIRAEYKGIVPNEQVKDIFSQYDLFFFPTHGENFGHVILEALSAGCPVLISNQTPWEKLDSYKSGWNFPIDEESKFIETINRCALCPPEDYLIYQRGANQYASEHIKSSNALEANQKMFMKA